MRAKTTLTFVWTIGCLLGATSMHAQTAADASMAALLKAAGKGDATEVKTLLENGARADAADPNGMTALHAAASAEVAALLIGKGALTTAKAKGGYAPLHHAVIRGRQEVVALLLEKGADPNATLDNGRTPLMLAAERQRLDAAKTLLTRNADPKLRDERGWTALHYAAMKSDIPMATLLIGAGGDVNAQSNGGGRPLHEAVPGGTGEIAEFLIARGADVNAKTKDGNTALAYAENFKNQAAIDVLKKHGATR